MRYMGPVLGNLSQVSYTLSATVGGILCLTSRLDLGGLTIFTNYSRMFSRPVSELSMQMNIIYAALAGAERVFAVMDEKPEVADPPDAIAICSEADRVAGAGHQREVVAGCDLCLCPRQDRSEEDQYNSQTSERIALVGSTERRQDHH